MRLGRCITFLPEEEPSAWGTSDLMFHQRILQLAMVMARLQRGDGRLRILDYGGAFGGHALGARRLLPHLDFDWTVCEMAGFCEHGRKLNPEVTFVSSFTEAGVGYDLVYASSSVQYEQDWRALLAKIRLAGSGSVYITRTPFVFKAPSFVTVQRAYGTEYPGWVFNLDEFVGSFTSLGCRLDEVFVNGRGIPVRGSREQNVHLGLLFSAKAGTEQNPKRV
jgi:putative methyltransferase (TIGR04325 family)